MIFLRYATDHNVEKEGDENMIISAYAGTGKTTSASQIEKTIDLAVMPYKWILPPMEKANTELEGEKGAFYHLSNPLYPENYIIEILCAEKEYDYVIIPTDIGVICSLQERYGRKVLLCYPSDECRGEYRERFIARGNSESFLSLFSDGWDHFLDPVKENQLGVHIVMKPGQYLTDLQNRFEEERRTDKTVPLPERQIHALGEELTARKKDLIFHLNSIKGDCFYSISDLDDPDERRFLYDIGRMISDAPVFTAIEPRSCVRALLEGFPENNRDEVKDFVNTSFTYMRQNAERREQLIYGRGFDPANYSSDGIAYFQGISMDMLRQLIAEGFLNPFERQNDSPTVKEMMDFCAGEDEDNWIFHGYTISPERIDYRVSIEGFEARTEPSSLRKKEFALFNHKASKLLLGEGECYCWYD